MAPMSAAFVEKQRSRHGFLVVVEAVL